MKLSKALDEKQRNTKSGSRRSASRARSESKARRRPADDAKVERHVDEGGARAC
jgi:hypothetical protein